MSIFDEPADRNWETRGACRGKDPEVFFPPSGVTPTEALETCRVCPVMSRCLDANLMETFGVFGGTTENVRRRLRRSLGLVTDSVPGPACGTTAGYHRHKRVGEAPCQSCCTAHAVRNKANAKRRKAAA